MFPLRESFDSDQSSTIQDLFSACDACWEKAYCCLRNMDQARARVWLQKGWWYAQDADDLPRMNFFRQQLLQLTPRTDQSSSVRSSKYGQLLLADLARDQLDGVGSLALHLGIEAHGLGQLSEAWDFFGQSARSCRQCADQTGQAWAYAWAIDTAVRSQRFEVAGRLQKRLQGWEGWPRSPTLRHFVETSISSYGDVARRGSLKTS